MQFGERFCKKIKDSDNLRKILLKIVLKYDRIKRNKWHFRLKRFSRSACKQLKNEIGVLFRADRASYEKDAHCLSCRLGAEFLVMQ